MAFDGSEGKMIDRTTAQQLLADYRNSNARTANGDIDAIFFGKDHLMTLLGQPGAMGIRIYFGKSGTADGDAAELALVAADANENDMTAKILDVGVPCPNECSSASTRLG